MSYRFVVLILLCVGVVACKPTSEKKPDVASEPAAKVPTGSLPLTPKQEEAITKEFITRFTDAIDADDVNLWSEVITKERVARFKEKGTIDEVYAAWRRGTATVSDRIRKAPFRLDPGDQIRTLHFEGVIVANDPDTSYSMSVRIVDGKMYLDEN